MGAARLIERTRVGGGVSLLAFEVAPAMSATYARPGQYAEMTARGERGFFVIASDVGAARWEFLMRGGGGAADTLLVMPLGEELSIEGALGDGFPCEDARGRPLVVATTGTGIAVARPIVAMRMHDGETAPTEIYLGVRAPEDAPLMPELERWHAQGVRVTVCLSRADAPAARGRAESVRYERGHVQDVMRKRLAQAPSWLVFAVGAPGMVDGVREVARTLRADVKTNY